MGRYYSGDIEGKFWFAVQESDDASYFGGESWEPETVTYYFDEDDLLTIRAGIAKCKKFLGEYESKLDKFFEENNGYNDLMLIKAGFPASKIKDLLVYYARLGLGEKILKCVEQKGKCEFQAEA